MTIQDLIGAVVALMDDTPTFIHGNKGWQNLEVDEIKDDVVILDEPVTSNDDYRKSGLLEENYTLIIYFFTKSELDYTPAQHKPLIEAMRTRRRDFINRLSDYSIDGQKQIRAISGIRTVDLINVFDVNYTGVMLSITITPFNFLPHC